VKPTVREGFGLGGSEGCIFGDADHGEDFDEVRREANGEDLLAGSFGFNEELDDEGDAAGVDVVDLGEIEQDELDAVLGQGLVGAQDCYLGRAGNVSLEAESGNRLAGRRGELVDVDLVSLCTIV